MSDVCDRADTAVAAVQAAGGRFVNRNRGGAVLRHAALPPCACGGRPVYRAAAGCGGETLACSRCAASVGPYPARHQLDMEWRLRNAAN